MLIFTVRDRLQSSGSDVYRRQILTTKVDPRAVRVNVGLRSVMPPQHQAHIDQYLVFPGILIRSVLAHCCLIYNTVQDTGE